MILYFSGTRNSQFATELVGNFFGAASVVMPENYLAMFPTPTESE